MNCPACGHGNPDERLDCRKCGALLDQEIIATAVGDDTSEAPTEIHSGAAEPQLTPAGFGLEPGVTLGNRYQITNVLGTGGMGIVYRARDVRLHRDVALKVIRPELLAHPDIGERFRREILLASKITHKNILRIHDLGESDGLSYISMAYVDGETLAELLDREGPQSPARTVALATQLCHALEAAHEAGVIHRDLKPQNVLIDRDGNAYIADFGISRSLESGETMTRDGAVVGTLNYMAPEQARGETLDHRADVYSLGMVMYRMLVGKLPFDKGSSITSVLRRVQEDVPDVRTQRSDIPLWLSRIVYHALRRDPAERYATAQEMRRNLEQQQSVSRRRRLPSTRFLVSAGLALLLLAAIGFAAMKAIGTLGDQPASDALARPASSVTSLALLPIVNGTQDPTLAWMTTALPDLLQADLRQSGGLRLVDGGRVREGLERLGVAAGNAAGPKTVGTLARSLAVEHVLTGELTRRGDELRLQADLGTVGAGTITATVPIDVAGTGEDALFAMVDALGSRILAELGTGGGDRPVREITTGSVEAWRGYSEGLALTTTGEMRAAAARFESSTELDTGFALAHLSLAETLDALGDPTQALERTRQAERNGDRLSSYQAARVGAVKALLQDDLETAEQSYRRMVQFAPGDVPARLGLASVQQATGDMAGAIASVEAAIELDPRNAGTKMTLGRLSARTGDLGRSLDQFEAARRDYDNERNEDGQAAALNAIGAIHNLRDENERALENFGKALEIRRRLGDRTGEATTLYNMAYVFEARGDLDEAIATMTDVAQIWGELNDPAEEAQAFSTLGDFQQNAGRASDAQSSYRRSLDVLRDVDDEFTKAWTLSSMGSMKIRTGEYSEAHIFLEEALSKRRELNDETEIAVSLSDLGILEQIQGRYDRATDYYTEGLDISRRMDNVEGQIVFNANLGTILADRGEYGQALERIEESARRARVIEEKSLIASCLEYLGGARRGLGDHAGARQALDEALAVARELGNQETLAQVQIERAALSSARGESDRAREAAREAVTLADGSMNHRLQLRAGLRLGLIESSRPGLEDVIERAAASDLRPLIAPARVGLARIHLATKQHDRTTSEAEKALEAAGELGQTDLIFEAEEILGRSLRMSGDQDGAAGHYLAAAAALEQMLSGLDPQQRGYLVDRDVTRRFLEDATLLMNALGRTEEAERVAGLADTGGPAPRD